MITGMHLPQANADALQRWMQRQHPQAVMSAAPLDIQRAIERVRKLLEGERNDDLQDIALDMSRVPLFHQQVYAATRRIAPGRTRSYGEIAAEIGAPQAAREVGTALGLNPFAPIVPCHRVLAAGGRSGGFSAAGGVATKLKLLQIENAQIGDAPDLFQQA